MSDDDKNKDYKETRKRADEFQPTFHSSNPRHGRRDLLKDVLPKNSTLAPISMSRTANFFAGNPGSSSPMGGGGGGGGTALYHMQRPYLPDIESPDRQQYPEDRLTANRYWRMFHKYDPIFGTAIDMYSEMLVSEYDIVVSDDSNEIKDTINYMCETVNLFNTLKNIIKEYLVIGECIPSCFFSNELGIWTYVSIHNPDYIEVKDIPVVNNDPILYFIPDDNLITSLSDGTPESMELRRRLPSEFVSKVLTRQKIQLSPLNSTFIARKLHQYDNRGTSLASRMWRIFMVEDAVYNSTIATFRRHASPLKVLKLGDPASGWIPAPGTETKLLEMLNRAELDPQSWIIYHYGIQFEAWGTTDRAITISKEHDTIEKIKLTGLGLSKSFMSGEVTYASAKSGLQVFLRRLLSLRQFMESIWLYPKFFKPISEIHKWYKVTPSEVSHGYRIKRTADEMKQNNMIIMPEIRWKNKLDPKVDSETISAYGQLEKFGIKLSKKTVSAAAGIDWREELNNSLTEFKEEEEAKDNTLGPALKKKFEEATGEGGSKPKPKPPGGAGSGALPPGAKGDASHPPGSSDKPTDKGPIDEKLDAPDTGMPGGVE